MISPLGMGREGSDMDDPGTFYISPFTQNRNLCNGSNFAQNSYAMKMQTLRLGTWSALADRKDHPQNTSFTICLLDKLITIKAMQA